LGGQDNRARPLPAPPRGAAGRARPIRQGKGLLISNDKLRDHTFEVNQRLFGRWRQQHQVQYSLTRGGAVALDPPPPFTACVQQLPGSGAWMLPAADRAAWLMVVPKR
jgi:hypothetical protein